VAPPQVGQSDGSPLAAGVAPTFTFTTDDRVKELETQIDHLTTALQNRPRIEHAVGILMVLMSCDADTAVASLKVASQLTNRKLLAIADLMVASVATGALLPPDVLDCLSMILPPRQQRGVSTQTGATLAP